MISRSSLALLALLLTGCSRDPVQPVPSPDEYHDIGGKVFVRKPPPLDPKPHIEVALPPGTETRKPVERKK